MATGWVRAMFLNAQTRPMGLPQKPEPTPFNKWVFFCALNPPRWAPWALPKIRNPKKKTPRSRSSTYISLIKSPKKKKKPQNAKIMFINLDQKPKNKNPRSYSSIGTKQQLKTQKQTQKFQIFYFYFQNHKHKHKHKS